LRQPRFWDSASACCCFASCSSVANSCGAKAALIARHCGCCSFIQTLASVRRIVCAWVFCVRTPCTRVSFAGGAERLVVDAAVGLQLRGHKIAVYTSHHSQGHCFAGASGFANESPGCSEPADALHSSCLCRDERWHARGSSLRRLASTSSDGHCPTTHSPSQPSLTGPPPPHVHMHPLT
jgi:hypothetical protein